MAPHAEGPSNPEITSETEDEVFNEEQPRNDPPRQQPRATQNSKFITFTIDDIPPSQWRQRFQEFKAWIIIETQRPGITPQGVLFSFASRFTGTLHEWWTSLGEYRQL